MANCHITHGLTKHPLFGIWMEMKKRCYNKNYKQFYDYGGRGIKICDEWLNDFQTFYNFCLKNGWKYGLQIDRKDNDKNYTPDNCRFVTHADNVRNARKTKFWVINKRKYKSSSLAAKGERVSRMTIMRWCGVISSKGKVNQKEGCYSYLKYPN